MDSMRTSGYDFIPNFGEVFQQRERAQVMSTEVSDAAQTKEQCASACAAANRCKAFQTQASLETEALECTIFASRLQYSPGWEYYEKQLTSSEAATLDAHNKRERSNAARTMVRALKRTHDLKVDDAANVLAKSPAAHRAAKRRKQRIAVILKRAARTAKEITDAADDTCAKAKEQMAAELLKSASMGAMLETTMVDLDANSKEETTELRKSSKQLSGDVKKLASASTAVEERKLAKMIEKTDAIKLQAKHVKAQKAAAEAAKAKAAADEAAAVKAAAKRKAARAAERAARKAQPSTLGEGKLTDEGWGVSALLEFNPLGHLDANALSSIPAAVVSSKQSSTEACGMQCTGLPACKAFVYNSASSLCELHRQLLRTDESSSYYERRVLAADVAPGGSKKPKGVYTAKPIKLQLSKGTLKHQAIRRLKERALKEVADAQKKGRRMVRTAKTSARYVLKECRDNQIKASAKARTELTAQSERLSQAAEHAKETYIVAKDGEAADQQRTVNKAVERSQTTEEELQRAEKKRVRALKELEQETAALGNLDANSPVNLEA